MMRHGALAWLGLAAACGGDPAPAAPVELAEYCGETAPVRLLELGADQYPSRNPLQGIRRVGDRLVYVIETYVPGTPFPADSGELVLAVEVHATGPCGEDPRRIADQVDFLFDARFEYGDVVLACRRDQDQVLRLDPSGESDPQVVLEGVGCAPLPAGGGIVGVRAHQAGSESGELIYRASLTDPNAPIEVLHDDALVPFEETGFYYADIRRLRTTGHEVLTLLASGEVLVIDVRDASAHVELPDVAGFELSYDGRFVLWQPGPPVTSGGSWGVDEMWLRDRETGEDLSLGSARFGIGTAGVQDGMVRATADFTSQDTLVVLLPSLQQLVFEPSRFVNGRHLPSGRVMWSPSAEDGTPGALHVLDPETGESEAVFDRYGGWTYFGDQFLLLEQTAEDHYTLWERHLDQPEQVRVVDDVFQPFFVSADRVAAVRDLDDDRHGTLVVVDRDSHAELEITDRANAFSSRLNWLGAMGDAFAWAVSDEAGSGIWAARVE
jgi:hypothetical protein